MKAQKHTIQYVHVNDILACNHVDDAEREIIEESLRDAFSFGDAKMTIITKQQFRDTVNNAEELLESVPRNVDLICIFEQ